MGIRTGSIVARAIVCLFVAALWSNGRAAQEPADQSWSVTEDRWYVMEIGGAKAEEMR